MKNFYSLIACLFLSNIVVADYSIKQIEIPQNFQMFVTDASINDEFICGKIADNEKTKTQVSFLSFQDSQIVVHEEVISHPNQLVVTNNHGYYANIIWKHYKSWISKDYYRPKIVIHDKNNQLIQLIDPPSKWFKYGFDTYRYLVDIKDLYQQFREYCIGVFGISDTNQILIGNKGYQLSCTKFAIWDSENSTYIFLDQFTRVYALNNNNCVLAEKTVEIDNKKERQLVLYNFKDKSTQDIITLSTDPSTLKLNDLNQVLIVQIHPDMSKLMSYYKDISEQDLLESTKNQKLKEIFIQEFEQKPSFFLNQTDNLLWDESKGLQHLEEYFTAINFNNQNQILGWKITNAKELIAEMTNRVNQADAATDNFSELNLEQSLVILNENETIDLIKVLNIGEENSPWLTLENALHINDKGVIIGKGRMKDEKKTYFVISP